jgi:hypothetical protein
MLYLTVKAALSGIIIAIVSEVARRTAFGFDPRYSLAVARHR